MNLYFIIDCSRKTCRLLNKAFLVDKRASDESAIKDTEQIGPHDFHLRKWEEESNFCES